MPATELVITIDPPAPWSIIWGMIALQDRQYDVRFTSIMSCHWSSVSS
jgi:hypothetical protein